MPRVGAASQRLADGDTCPLVTGADGGVPRGLRLRGGKMHPLMYPWLQHHEVRCAGAKCASRGARETRSSRLPIDYYRMLILPQAWSCLLQRVRSRLAFSV